MAFSNKKIQPASGVYKLLPPIMTSSIRSTEERTSNRARQCYGTGNTIPKGARYINHQFRYDKRIITVSFSLEFFNKPNNQP